MLKLRTTKLALSALFFYLFLFNFTQVHAEGTGGFVINEIMYDLSGSDTGREWVEIYNAGSSSVDISKWKFLESSTASNHALTQIQGESLILPGGFVVISNDPTKFLLDWPSFSGNLFKASFSLNNTGSTLILKDDSLAISDQASYVSSQGANGDGNSLQKVEDGSWQAKVSTPGEQNFIPTSSPPLDIEEDTTNISEETDPTLQPDLVPDETPSIISDAPIVDEKEISITEIMYDLLGADIDWVEVHNKGSSDVDLSLLKILINNSSSNHSIDNYSGSLVLHPGDYGIIVEKSVIENYINKWGNLGDIFTSSFSLPNDGGKVEINDGDKTSPIDSVTYTKDQGGSEDNNSLQRLSDNTFSAAPPTPGQDFIIPPDPIQNETGSLIPDPASLEDEVDNKKISINEINWTGEEGNQYGEWIELYNDSDKEIDLSGWGIFDGSSDGKLIINLTKKISSRGYYLIARTTESSKDFFLDADDRGQFESGGLSNEGKFLILKDNHGEIIESLDFSSGWSAGDNKTKETMQIIGKDWFTAKATPKAQNARNPVIITNQPISHFSKSENVVQNVVQDNVQSNVDPIIPGAKEVIKLISKIILPDSLTITLDPNDYSISIKNNKSEDIDISGFNVDMEGNSFIMPKNTILLAQSKMIIPARISGFGKKELTRDTFSVVDTGMDTNAASPEVKIIDKPKMNVAQGRNDIQEIKDKLPASVLVSSQGQGNNRMIGLKTKIHNLFSYIKNLFLKSNYNFRNFFKIRN